MPAAMVRLRLKRELQFWVRSQSEISGYLGRTRSGRRAHSEAFPTNGNAKRCNNRKRLNVSGLKKATKEEKVVNEGDEEAKSEVVEPESGGEEAKIGSIESVNDDSNSRVKEKTLRRFTRSLLKVGVKESTSEHFVREQVTRRRIPKVDFGGCFLCRGHDFDRKFGPRTVLLCNQCDKEFHVSCLKDHNMENLKELPKGKWFCCTGCSRIHSALEKLVVCGDQRLPNSYLNLIKTKHDKNSLDVRWRLLNGKIDTSGDTAALLSQALSIFHESFDRILVSGRSRIANRDLLPSIVFGKNFKGREFGGMYCAILLVNNVVVSAAIMRFFGEEFAELPLVATSGKVQGQGYFRALFTCLQKLLQLLNVNHLLLPAAEEVESIWIDKFGFIKLTQEEITKFRKDYQMMVFEGTSILHKSVPKREIIKQKRFNVQYQMLFR